MPCTRPTRQRDRAQHQHYHVCSLCKNSSPQAVTSDGTCAPTRASGTILVPSRVARRAAPPRKGSKKLKGVLVSEWSESSSPSPSTSSFEPMVFHEHASSILEPELEPVLPTPTRPQLQIHATELELVHPIPRISQPRSPLLDDPSCNDSGDSTSQADGDARELSVDMDMYAPIRTPPWAWAPMPESKSPSCRTRNIPRIAAMTITLQTQ
ncbi:hypothetical protein B0H14DRAFT_3525338 [Mycena olivaceomarginata]|nr:hypothetical protein B0H14DRAFT_3525338 [Mycena olivaceomarginata]